MIYIDRNDRFLDSSTSKGNQIKWVHNNKYIKADTMGYESVSEALVSEFLKYVKGIDFVDYTMCKINEDGKIYEGCCCDNFLSKGEEVVTLYRLLKLYGYIDKNGNLLCDSDKRVEFVISKVRKITEVDIRKYIYDTIKIDYIIRNEDRHLNNICLIKGNNGYRPAPIFDNGLSLLSDTSDYPLTNIRTDILIRKVKAKPFYTSFEKQFNYTDKKPLLLDYDGFIDSLSRCYVEFKDKEFERAAAVLTYNLLNLGGKVWIQQKR